MTYQYPKGYWSSVFDKAAWLMNRRGGLSGETAYWLARRMVDRGLALSSAPRKNSQRPAASLGEPEILTLTP